MEDMHGLMAALNPVIKAWTIATLRRKTVVMYVLAEPVDKRVEIIVKLSCHSTMITGGNMRPTRL